MKWWYRSSYTVQQILLLPFSWIFSSIVTMRYFLYRFGIKKSIRFSVPVIVVGNITVGGTGKTPLVIWLAHFLKSRGFQPGIVSRGAGGKKQFVPCWVEKNSDPNKVGDEAVLIARQTDCPLVIGIDRAAAVKELLSKTQSDCVISDDGLQHYRLARDIEIAVVDGARSLGNRSLLPAGPLREAPSRLKRVDFIITQGKELQLKGNVLVAMQNKNNSVLLEKWRGKTVHAVAGIGHPERFFSALDAAGLTVIPHEFPDHYQYKASDLVFSDSLPIVMTEKDAVKCEKFCDERFWYLPVKAVIDEELGEKIIKRISFS
jgi:tetraacyldisaccharide 4'-kinase